MQRSLLRISHSVDSNFPCLRWVSGNKDTSGRTLCGFRIVSYGFESLSRDLYKFWKKLFLFFVPLEKSGLISLITFVVFTLMALINIVISLSIVIFWYRSSLVSRVRVFMINGSSISLRSVQGACQGGDRFKEDRYRLSIFASRHSSNSYPIYSSTSILILRCVFPVLNLSEYRRADAVAFEHLSRGSKFVRVLRESLGIWTEDDSFFKVKTFRGRSSLLEICNFYVKLHFLLFLFFSLILHNTVVRFKLGLFCVLILDRDLRTEFISLCRMRLQKNGVQI